MDIYQFIFEINQLLGHQEREERARKRGVKTNKVLKFRNLARRLLRYEYYYTVPQPISRRTSIYFDLPMQCDSVKQQFLPHLASKNLQSRVYLPATVVRQNYPRECQQQPGPLGMVGKTVLLLLLLLPPKKMLSSARKSTIKCPCQYRNERSSRGRAYR
jgi:hypothetical protein